MTPRLMLALAALLPVLGWAQSVSLHGLLGRQALLIVDGKPPRAVAPGQTHLGNLGPLSSFTHRVKTHGGWRLEQPAPGTYRWRSPLGYQYAVTAAGTIRIGKPPPPEHHWWHQEPPDRHPPGDLGPPDPTNRAPIPPDPGQRQTPLPYVA